MPPRSSWARLALGVAAALVAATGARADVVHVTYRVSLIGLPIGAVNLDADLTPTSYSIQGDAKATGLARLLANARGASAGKGAIVQGHVSPATFATITANSHMTRTIRMALAGNAVTGIENLAAIRGQAGPGSAWARRLKGRRRSGRRGHHSRAALGTDRVAGRVRA